METIWASTVLLLTLVNAGMISASTMMAAPVEATGGDGGGVMGGLGLGSYLYPIASMRMHVAGKGRRGEERRGEGRGGGGGEGRGGVLEDTNNKAAVISPVAHPPVLVMILFTTDPLDPIKCFTRCTGHSTFLCTISTPDALFSSSSWTARAWPLKTGVMPPPPPPPMAAAADCIMSLLDDDEDHPPTETDWPDWPPTEVCANDIGEDDVDMLVLWLVLVGVTLEPIDFWLVVLVVLLLVVLEIGPPGNRVGREMG